jgi:hypothetical protein
VDVEVVRLIGCEESGVALRFARPRSNWRNVQPRPPANTVVRALVTRHFLLWLSLRQVVVLTLFVVTFVALIRFHGESEELGDAFIAADRHPYR